MTVDPEAWASPSLGVGPETFSCPECQEMHTWSKVDGYLDAGTPFG